MAEEEAKTSKNAVKRVRGVVIEKPIVVGSMAWPLAKKDESTVCFQRLKTWLLQSALTTSSQIILNIQTDLPSKILIGGLSIYEATRTRICLILSKRLCSTSMRALEIAQSEVRLCASIR